MQDLLGDYAVELGLPKAAGDPMNGRIPCQIVHQGQPYGCEVYAMNRFIKGFLKVYPVSIILCIMGGWGIMTKELTTLLLAIPLGSFITTFAFPNIPIVTEPG